MKKEKQFVKIKGILRDASYGTNFAFLSKMELSEPSETYKIIHNDNYGDEFIEFLEKQIEKRKEGAEFNIIHEIDDVESKLGDYYEDDCRDNWATAYLDLELITEKQFNNSDKWKEPSETRMRKIVRNNED